MARLSRAVIFNPSKIVVVHVWLAQKDVAICWETADAPERTSTRGQL
jgi:hypothetical protein